MVALRFSGTISKDSTLTLAKSPYVITSTLTIASQVTLTIQPGVIVKFQPGDVRMDVQGTLIANGAVNDSIIFTSYYDDTYGGDTNGDGSATLPSPGDWTWVEFDGSGIGTKVNYCVFRYGGRNFNGCSGYVNNTVRIHNSTVNITNSIIK